MTVRIETSLQKNNWGESISHLVIDGYIWMSNSDEELNEMTEDIKDARGCCWIGGLGLGLMPAMLANKNDVESITVIEINKEIIDLVAPGLEKKYPGKIRIWHGDALTEQAFLNTKYDWMYLDTYIEPTERVYKEEVLLWLNSSENFGNEGCIRNWWHKEKMLKGKFAPFEIEK